MEPSSSRFMGSSSGEDIVETITCRWCAEKFDLTVGDRDMLETLTPVIAGIPFQLSWPDLCPRCRRMKRLVFRNERKFYHAKCTKCGKNEISTISPDAGRRIMCVKCYNDEDFLKYGVEYSGNFQASIETLFSRIPYCSRLIHNMENSDYCNQETDDKDSYLNAGGHFNQNSLYNTYSIHGTYTVDNYWVIQSENVWRSLNIHSSSKVFSSEFIESCYNIFFGYDLKGCKNVIFGHGLVNQEYVYKNRILKKDEWEALLPGFLSKLGTHSGLLELIREYEDFIKSFPKRDAWNTSCEHVLGNENSNVKDAFMAFIGENAQHIRYANIYADIKDCMDVESFGWSEKTYNTVSSIKTNHSVAVSHSFSDASRVYYSYFLTGGSDVIGSSGLKNQSGVIFNRSYEKEEYDRIAKQIAEELSGKGKWGDFFETALSPYPYNDTVAMEYYPVRKAVFLDNLTKKVLLEKIIDPDGRGTVYVLEPAKPISPAILDLGGAERVSITWRTKENEINIPAGIDLLSANDIPDSITQVTDDILKKAIICERSGRPFRLVGEELAFCRKHFLPVPRIHPDERHIEKIRRKASMEFRAVDCIRCGKTVSTPISNDPKRIICEDCIRSGVEDLSRAVYP